jgi:hypothetical protein
MNTEAQEIFISCASCYIKFYKNFSFHKRYIPLATSVNLATQFYVPEVISVHVASASQVFLSAIFLLLETWK